jgi:hypothetical protein
MTVNARILERINIVEAWPVVDLQTGANDGDWVSLKNYKRVLCVLMASVGTASQDPIITMEQASAVAGTGAKALTVVTAGWTKIGTTNLTAVGTWTAVAQAAAATFTAVCSASDKILAIEITADQLDADNGFDCIRMRVADTGGNAQLGIGFYILADPRYPDAPENMLSAIVD